MNKFKEPWRKEKNIKIITEIKKWKTNQQGRRKTPQKTRRQRLFKIRYQL